MKTTPTLLLPYPESTDSADVPRDIKALADAIDPLGIAPVGAMFMWPAASAPADADATGRLLWLLCIGQAVSAASYPKLATLLGQAGGNVTIPDMRDRFPSGAGVTMALGSTGGVASVVLSIAHMPAHDHGGVTDFRDRSQSHVHGSVWQGGTETTIAAGQPYGINANQPTAAADATDHRHYLAAQGGGQGHENRPPFRAVNFIIRAG
jgi:microcystin-dependent protein